MAELLQGGFTDLRNQNSLALVKHSSDSNLYINFFKYSGIKSMVPNNFSRQISTAGEEETTPQLFLSFPSFLILTISFPVITLFTSVFYIEVSYLVISTCGCFPWPGSYKGQERLYLHDSPSFPRDLYVSLLISSGF